MSAISPGAIICLALAGCLESLMEKVGGTGQARIAGKDSDRGARRHLPVSLNSEARSIRNSHLQPDGRASDDKVAAE